METNASAEPQKERPWHASSAPASSSARGGFLRVCWIVTMLLSALAALFFVLDIVNAKSAPQQAAAAGIAIALCVIPYVFTRAIEGLRK